MASRTTIIHSTRHLCLSFSDHRKLCATPGCWKEQNRIKYRCTWPVDASGHSGILAHVPEDDELHAAELVDLLTEDNADGRARRFALAPWLTFERPVIARFLGETCILTIEGPIYLKDDFGYPLGSQMQTEFGWLALPRKSTRR